MAQWYVVALMETRNASNRRGVGYRSFWLGHSGPYDEHGIAALVAETLTGAYGLEWRGARYYLKDAFAVPEDQLDIYGLTRKREDMQVLLPGLREVE